MEFGDIISSLVFETNSSDGAHSDDNSSDDDEAQIGGFGGSSGVFQSLLGFCGFRKNKSSSRSSFKTDRELQANKNFKSNDQCSCGQNGDPKMHLLRVKRLKPSDKKDEHLHTFKLNFFPFFNSKEKDLVSEQDLNSSL